MLICIIYDARRALLASKQAFNSDLFLSLPRLQATGKRPLGVSVLGWLSLVFGILGVLAGILVSVLFAALIPSLIEQGIFDEVPIERNDEVARVTSPEFTSAMINVGIFIIVMSGLTVVMGYGLLKRTSWSWIFAVGLIIASLAISLLMNTVDVFGTARMLLGEFAPFSEENISGTLTSIALNVAISLLILYYLFRPRVRAYLTSRQPA